MLRCRERELRSVLLAQRATRERQALQDHGARQALWVQLVLLAVPWVRQDQQAREGQQVRLVQEAQRVP